MPQAAARRANRPPRRVLGGNPPPPGRPPPGAPGAPPGVGVSGMARGLGDPGVLNEENADAAKKLQRISIGPVSRGDADAVYAVCVSRGLVAAGLYKSGWSV